MYLLFITIMIFMKQVYKEKLFIWFIVLEGSLISNTTDSRRAHITWKECKQIKGIMCQSRKLRKLGIP